MNVRDTEICEGETEERGFSCGKVTEFRLESQRNWNNFLYHPLQLTWYF